MRAPALEPPLSDDPTETDAPESTGFADLGLDPQILAGVKALGFDDPTPIQLAAIPPLLAGRDVLGRARTGSGKTAAFGLPALQLALEGGKGVRVLILTPTRELALQVTEALESYVRGKGVGIVPVYGGTAYGPQLKGLQRGANIVVGTPGRVLDHMERGSIDLGGLELLVLDEADEMLRMGFIDDVEKIISAAPADRQIALFSATMPDPIRRIANTHLRDPQEVQVEGRSLSVDHIAQQHVVVPFQHKLDALVRLLGVIDGAALVFTRTRQTCAEVAGLLADRGLDADAIHGDLQQAARETVLGRLRSGRLRVLVATDVAARGIDVEHIGLVVNLELPSDPESYVHRIGRTGRAGRQGLAITLVTPHERRRIRGLEFALNTKIPLRAVPSEAEMARHQRQGLHQQMAEAMGRGGQGAQAWLDELTTVGGWSANDVARAALSLLAHDRGINLDPSLDDQPPHWSLVDAPRPRERREPMEEVELFLPIGKRTGTRAADIVGALANDMGIPGNAVGRIALFDRKTFVRLPKVLGEPLIGGRLWIRGHDVPIVQARPDAVPQEPTRHRKGPPRRDP